MPPKDADALAVWDARARTLIDRIDAVLEEDGPTGHAATDDPLGALVHRVITQTPPPPGEIITPPTSPTPTIRTSPRRAPSNMGPPPDRIDHWDAYVCRFDSDGSEATGSPAL